MKHKLVSLFFATMALIGSAGTVFVYLLLSTVVCDSVDGSFLICSFVTWFFVFFCFFTIVVLPIYISIKTWKQITQYFGLSQLSKIIISDIFLFFVTIGWGYTYLMTKGIIVEVPPFTLLWTRFAISSFLEPLSLLSLVLLEFLD